MKIRMFFFFWHVDSLCTEFTELIVYSRNMTDCSMQLLFLLLFLALNTLTE